LSPNKERKSKFGRKTPSTSNFFRPSHKLKDFDTVVGSQKIIPSFKVIPPVRATLAQVCASLDHALSIEDFKDK